MGSSKPIKHKYTTRSYAFTDEDAKEIIQKVESELHAVRAKLLQSWFCDNRYTEEKGEEISFPITWRDLYGEKGHSRVYFSVSPETGVPLLDTLKIV